LMLVQEQRCEFFAVLDTCHRFRSLASDYHWTLPMYDLHGDPLPYSQEISLGDPALRAQLRENYLHWSAKVNLIYFCREPFAVTRTRIKPWNVLRLAIKLDQRLLLAKLMEHPETRAVLHECGLLRRYVYLSGSRAMMNFFGLSKKSMQKFMSDHPIFAFRCRKADWEFEFDQPGKLRMALVWYTTKERVDIYERVLACMAKHILFLDWTTMTWLNSKNLPNTWKAQLRPPLDSRYNIGTGEIYSLVLSGELRLPEKTAPPHGRCKARRTNFYCTEFQ